MVGLIHDSPDMLIIVGHSERRATIAGERRRVGPLPALCSSTHIDYVQSGLYDLQRRYAPQTRGHRFGQRSFADPNSIPRHSQRRRTVLYDHGLRPHADEIRQRKRDQYREHCAAPLAAVRLRSLFLALIVGADEGRVGNLDR